MTTLNRNEKQTEKECAYLLTASYRILAGWVLGSLKSCTRPYVQELCSIFSNNKSLKIEFGFVWFNQVGFVFVESDRLVSLYVDGYKKTKTELCIEFLRF